MVFPALQQHLLQPLLLFLKVTLMTTARLQTVVRPIIFLQSRTVVGVPQRQFQRRLYQALFLSLADLILERVEIVSEA